MTTNHHYRRFIKAFYTQKIKTNIAIKEWELLNLKRIDK
jgi:hypothetical protein